MSEPELTPITPKTTAIPHATQPKTSAVPLKKETVRITLRARPGSGVTQPRESTSPVSLSPTTGSIPTPSAKHSTAPISLPSAPLPPPSPKSSTSPVSLPPAPIPPPGRKTMAVPTAAPAPMAPPPPSAAPPAPTAARPQAPGAPRPAAPGAPRPAAPGAPRMETGAATQPLAAAPRPPMAGGPRAPTPGAGTAPLVGGAATSALPKATQKLQAATQPMARPAISAPPSAPIKRAQLAADSEQFYEEKDPEAGLVPLSVICLVLSIALMMVQMFATDKLEMERTPLIGVTHADNPQWEVQNTEDGTFTSKFKDMLPDIPQ